MSSGLATATGSSTVGSNGSSRGTYTESSTTSADDRPRGVYVSAAEDWRGDCNRYRAARIRDPEYRDVVLERGCRNFWGAPNAQGVRREGGLSSEPGAWVTGFAGAQKVMGSDGSFSLAAAVVDRRFRLDASFTQYYETEMTGDRITMMAPELSAGVHLGGDASTRVWLESGVLYLKTSDPAGGSTVVGPTFGTRCEHQMSPDLAMAGTVEGAYLQDGVRGISARVAVRFHHVEAAVRVLALNVGPALYGPEVGVGF